jgi:hypothetical protein
MRCRLTYVFQKGHCDDKLARKSQKDPQTPLGDGLGRSSLLRYKNKLYYLGLHSYYRGTLSFAFRQEVSIGISAASFRNSFASAPI